MDEFQQPITEVTSLVGDVAAKLQAACRTIARLEADNALLRGQIRARDTELRRAWARIEKLQTRERAFIRELIREMTLTAGLTERLEEVSDVQ